MLEWRYEVVGTCHGMSPKAMIMRGIALADMLMRGIASADMPWHVPTAMSAFLKFVTS